MDHSPSHRSKPALLRSYLLLACLLLSLLGHLLIIAVLRDQSPLDEPTPQPTLIELVDYPLAEERHAEEDPTRQPTYEIDQPPAPPDPDLQVESERRAERDQLVEREQAPEGDDVRDQRRAADPAPAPPVPPPSPPAEPMPQPAPPTAAPAPPRPSAPPLAEGDSGPLPTPETDAAQDAPEPPAESPPAADPPQLTREQLFPDARVLQDIARGDSAERDRIRERDDVEIGDEVWLNLQHDRLVSFFRRFHDRVDRVWNYPSEAIANGVEGTLELLIIVTREGELVDVDLRRSSGSDLLDFEAIQAVYRAAPFGPLGRHYPHEELRIRANFRYRIAGRYIFGR
ncbi:MAG: energy transducer TonB [Pelovirga sp.]